MRETKEKDRNLYKDGDTQIQDRARDRVYMETHKSRTEQETECERENETVKGRQRPQRQSDSETKKERLSGQETGTEKFNIALTLSR